MLSDVLHHLLQLTQVELGHIFHREHESHTEVKLVIWKMYYLLKFIYDVDTTTFVVLNQEEYEAFKECEGATKPIGLSITCGHDSTDESDNCRYIGKEFISDDNIGARLREFTSKTDIYYQVQAMIEKENNVYFLVVLSPEISSKVDCPLLQEHSQNIPNQERFVLLTKYQYRLFKKSGGEYEKFRISDDSLICTHEEHPGYIYWRCYDSYKIDDRFLNLYLEKTQDPVVQAVLKWLGE